MKLQEIKQERIIRAKLAARCEILLALFDVQTTSKKIKKYRTVEKLTSEWT